MARRLLLIAVLTALSLTPLARADGDPASDYLLSQTTFVPPDDGVPAAYASQLQATVHEAKARGYTIRVALIGHVYDLGAVTVLFRKPQQYARFLGTELSFVYKGRLLVVMPNGLGVSRGGKAQPRDQEVVDRVAAPGTDGAALASAATTAVVELAAGAGVDVPRAALSTNGRSGPSTTRDRIIIATAALAVVSTAFGLALVRRRRKA